MTSNAGGGMQAMTRARGFTLVELMIVVVIIAILAAIAIPAFGRYAYRAHRVDGQELLLRIANAQERFYATNNHYGSLSDVGYAAPVNSEKGYYVATSDVASGSTSAQAFTATATPQNGQVNDVCGSLTINNAGIKTPGPASASSNSNGSCW
ncbi:type IV pilin protein [Rhodanobacter terrae]|uniref:Type IV pilin protein n=1 Tax=Rhodanobacter terrae TaxID=418647 RepID=A0ABW0SV64_9GAMM